MYINFMSPLVELRPYGISLDCQIPLKLLIVFPKDTNITHQDISIAKLGPGQHKFSWIAFKNLAEAATDLYCIILMKTLIKKV